MQMQTEMEMEMEMEATLTNSMPQNSDPSQADSAAHTHLAAVFNTFRKLTLHLHVAMTRQTHMEHRPHDHRR